MQKLKNKLFYTIFIILTISIVSIITIFNIQTYLEKRNSINTNLNTFQEEKRTATDEVPPPKKDSSPLTINEDEKNIKFMDTIMYTVLLDDNNNIKDIINHSSNDTSNEEITVIATKILKSNPKNKYIGSLYFNNFAYSYHEHQSLTIIDISKIKSGLLTSLFISFLIFLVLEILIFIISRKITSWLIKPVETTFQKQKEFIEDASHELKTPLSVIITSCDMLESSTKNNKWLTNIKNESNRMNSLISDLLDLASTEHEETFNMKLDNISKVIELSVLTFEAKAYEKDLILNYSIEPDINIYFDENSIKQLIEILLDNAIKHSKAATAITVTLTSSKNIVELKIKNHGDTIPKGEEEKIFERFYRIDKSRNRNENRYGLGLAIAKNIVNKHQGTIKAYSTKDVTTFQVLLKK